MDCGRVFCRQCMNAHVCDDVGQLHAVMRGSALMLGFVVAALALVHAVASLLGG